MVTIYGLKDPRTKEIRYVGRSINVSARYKKHIYGAEKAKHKTHRDAWIVQLKSEGLKPELVILEEVEQNIAIESEMKWIESQKLIYNLTNLRDYVDNNYLFSEESRKKMSNSQKGNTNRKGKKSSDETRALLSAKLKGRVSPMKGKVFSAEHKLKMKEAWKTREPDSEETRKKKSIATQKVWEARKNKEI